MWKNINRRARANPLFLWLANLLVVLALTYATGETAPLMSHWQYDLVWFLIATGWIAVAVALTLLSLNLWAEFDARLRDRRQSDTTISLHSAHCRAGEPALAWRFRPIVVYCS